LTDFDTALYEMLRNEEVVKVLEFCRRRATYYYLKLKILKQDFHQQKVEQDQYDIAFNYLEGNRFTCFHTLIDIAEAVAIVQYKRKDGFLCIKISKGIHELSLKLATRSPDDIKKLSYQIQDFILNFDLRDLHFELFNMFRRNGQTQDLQNVKSRYLADFIKDQVIKEIATKEVPKQPETQLATVDLLKESSQLDDNFHLTLKTLNGLKQYGELYKYIMERLNNKESALDVAKRLEWLNRMKGIVHLLDGDAALLANIVSLQKMLFEQTLILNKIKRKPQ